MPRFVLIDQSIEHAGGHHAEYAARVLRAARAEGFTPVLATNRRYQVPAAGGGGGAREEWEVHPVYRYGFWEKPLKAPRLDRGLWARVIRPGFWARMRARLAVSPIGLAAQLMREGANPVAAVLRAGFNPVVLGLGLLVTAPVLIPAAIVAFVLKIVWSVMPAKVFLRALGRGLVRLLLLPAWPVLFAVRNRRRIVRAVRTPVKRRAFGEDTLRLMKELHPAEGDVIFIPTLSELEMAGLLGAFDRSEDSRRPTWHLLFRQNIYRGREPDFAAQDEWMRPARNTFRAFVEGLSGQTVRLYTDTDELTAQYNRLGVARFSTLPIPVDAEFTTLAGRPAHSPMRIVYAGDAREEKGFASLPRLIDDLWDEFVEPGIARFVVQAYFNGEFAADGTKIDPRRRGGANGVREPACKVAMTELERFAPPQVITVRKPLGGVAYREFVCDADVMLLAYDADNYAARSSGIFSEALAAGIPTVVSAGSWMAQQLEPAIVAHHRAVARGERGRLIARHEGAALAWRIGDAEHGRARPTESELTVAGDCGASVEIVVPPNATHVLIGCNATTVRWRDGMTFRLEAFTARNEQLSGEEAMSGGHGSRYSRIFAIPAGAARLVIRLAPSNTATIATLTNIEVVCVDEPALARFAAGAVFTKSSELTACVREVLRHASHYRSSACELARGWAPQHTPAWIVRCLMSGSGGEWESPGLAVPAGPTGLRTGTVHEDSALGERDELLNRIELRPGASSLTAGPARSATNAEDVS